ncbi:MAG TPA: hypothetical protein VM689_01525 [Aliidongia sp.]|nr:hypothetical protein [Aliidongia sp.]
MTRTPPAPPPARTEPPPPHLVAELLAVSDRLAGLLVRETEILRAPGIPDVTAIAPDKLKLTARYDILMRAVHQGSTIDLRQDPDAAKLAASLERLNGLARDNAKAIDLHLKATKRVLELIARAARKATQPNFTYGKQRLGYGARSERHAALSVNRVL